MTREQLAILTAFQNNIEIFSSNYNGSLVSFSKEIVTFALTGVKYSRRRKIIVLCVKKSLNEHGSHSFMLIKGLFTWSGGPRSSGVGFFCFVFPRA